MTIKNPALQTPPLPLGITAAQGYQIATAQAGLKSSGLDLCLLQSQTPAVAAGVFTRNQVIGAPVTICAEHLAHPTVRAVITNSGNANCCTGSDGLEKARQMCRIAAEKVGCVPEEVLVCSTGIIGVSLPLEKIAAHVPSMNWSSGVEADLQAAQAIMTTDLAPKYFSASADIEGKTVTLGGMVKGSGMIGPNMGAAPGGSSPGTPHATMLAFLTTDAAVEKVLLQHLLEEAVDKSFNSVTVDGDTSSNDTCLLLANGASGLVINDQNKVQFSELLQKVCAELAKKVAADGEGATHLMEIQIRGAASAEDAHKVAMTVANSPLVKTAIFGGDPNWGRLAVAAGRAGVLFSMANLSIRLGDIDVLRNGEPVEFDEAQAAAQLKPFEIVIRIEIGKNNCSWTAWTCDYSYDYIKINAEYHT
jgi:glutamate N-acetyltransferase/amino-acid N-acetyltransferase